MRCVLFLLVISSCACRSSEPPPEPPPPEVDEAVSPLVPRHASRSAPDAGRGDPDTGRADASDARIDVAVGEATGQTPTPTRVEEPKPRRRRRDASAEGLANPLSPGTVTPPAPQRPSANEEFYAAFRFSTPLTTEGPLEQTAVRRVIRARTVAYRRCVEYVLARDPSLTGAATISLTVGGDGRVEAATIAPDTLPEALSSCMTKTTMRLRFPLSDAGSTDVRVPFVFRMQTRRKLDTAPGSRWESPLR